MLSVFVFAPLLGLLLDRILLRRLASAPVYARIVGTIGLLVALPALIQWLVIAVGNDVLGLGFEGNDAINEGLHVPGIYKTPHDTYKIGGVVLNSDQIAVFVVAAIAAIILWFVIRRTRVGLEMRAVVDRDSLARIRGVNAARTSAVAWILTMILAGLGGVLIAPLFQLQDFVFTLVVLGSLAAVVLGGLRSIPIAFAGGLLLGVIQNLVAGYSDDILPKFLSDLGGLRSSVPYLLVIVLLLFIGRDRSRRAGSVADDVAPPDHRDGTVEAAPPAPLGDLDVDPRRLLVRLVRVGLAARRRVRPDRDRAEPGDGDHLPVVRRRHRHERPGEPDAGELRDRGRLRRGLGAHPRLRRRHPGHRRARAAQLLLGGGDRRAWPRPRSARCSRCR